MIRLVGVKVVGKGCTLRFGELHNPASEPMRFIAAEDEREEAARNPLAGVPI